MTIVDKGKARKIVIDKDRKYDDGHENNLGSSSVNAAMPQYQVVESTTFVGVFTLSDW